MGRGRPENPDASSHGRIFSTRNNMTFSPRTKKMFRSILLHRPPHPSPPQSFLHRAAPFFSHRRAAPPLLLPPPESRGGPILPPPESCAAASPSVTELRRPRPSSAGAPWRPLPPPLNHVGIVLLSSTHRATPSFIPRASPSTCASPVPARCGSAWTGEEEEAGRFYNAMV